MTERPWQQWTVWYRASARSSEEARERTTYEKLLARMKELGLKRGGLRILSGSAENTALPVTAGFGLGFERCVMYLTGMSNIRDVIPFPRTVGNCEI